MNPCADAPLRVDLGDVDCITAAVQSGADVTKGTVGLLEADGDVSPASALGSSAWSTLEKPTCNSYN